MNAFTPKVKYQNLTPEASAQVTERILHFAKIINNTFDKHGHITNPFEHILLEITLNLTAFPCVLIEITQRDNTLLATNILIPPHGAQTYDLSNHFPRTVYYSDFDPKNERYLPLENILTQRLAELAPTPRVRRPQITQCGRHNRYLIAKMGFDVTIKIKPMPLAGLALLPYALTHAA